MKTTKQAYQQAVAETAARSPLLRDCAWAFVVGGLICALGEAATEGYSLWMAETDARMLTSVSLMLAAMVLTGCGWFDRIAKHAGAGTLVPITGFANAVVSPAIEYKSEGFVLGTAAKMFTVAGPVLVFGVSASALYGAVRYALIAWGVI